MQHRRYISFVVAPTVLAAALVLLASPAPAVAQEIEVGPDNAAVVAGGHGEVTLRPDRATVSVTVRTIAPEPDDASSRNLAAAEAVTAAIDALDLDPDSLL